MNLMVVWFVIVCGFVLCCNAVCVCVCACCSMRASAGGRSASNNFYLDNRSWTKTDMPHPPTPRLSLNDDGDPTSRNRGNRITSKQYRYSRQQRAYIDEHNFPTSVSHPRAPRLGRIFHTYTDRIYMRCDATAEQQLPDRYNKKGVVAERVQYVAM